jgi:ABC-type sugar transport system substrate-binding protein
MKKLPLLFTGALALGTFFLSASARGAEKRPTVGFLVIGTNNVYFMSCYHGAQKAAAELGVDLILGGPAEPDPARQDAIVDEWIRRGVDAIAAACDDKDRLSAALRRAESHGIKVITYDADAQADARAFFVNQATAESIGTSLMDDAARLCGGEGQYAMITANLTSANENGWRHWIDERNRIYPGIKMVAIRPCDDNIEKARVEAAGLLKSYPDLKLIMAICSPGVPGAVQAVQEAGKVGQVKVIGLGLPNENKRYVHEGVTNNIILWRTEDLGSLTLRAAVALVQGRLKPGDQTLAAGSLGAFQVNGDQILLGKPFVFDRANIDQFDF